MQIRALAATADGGNGAIGQVATTAHSVLAQYYIKQQTRVRRHRGKTSACGTALAPAGATAGPRAVHQSLRLRQQGDAMRK